MSSSPPPTPSASSPTTSGSSAPPPTSPSGSSAPPPSPPSSPPLSPPPPSSGSPPPITPPSPPVPSTSPPPSASAPPPPSSGSPPPITPPSPPVPSTSPPPSASAPPPITTPVVSPPPASPATPPPPSVPSIPSTPNAPPPSSGAQTPPSSQPPPSPTPPRSSPPPPSAKPPNNSPSSPSLPPLPANNVSQPTPSPPKNSSGGTAPDLPSPSPPISITPPGSSSNQNSPGSDVPSRQEDRNPNHPDGGIKTGPAAAIGIVAALVIFSVVGLAVVCFTRKRRKPTVGYNAGFVMPSPFTSSIISDSSMPRSPTAPLVHYHKSQSTERMNSLSETAMAGTSPWFSYEELYDITNGFSPQNILGEGGFGSVYKGCLPDGREVAVKRLKLGSGQGDREFKAEVEIISRVHHRHLVSLVGYCIADYQRLLVYDYVPNGALESHLHGDRRPVMNWATRVKVAAGAARGIAYLHEDCHPRIIHRDIKSSNILLDNNFEALVSDFGLARLALDACTHVTTRVMGTFGYLAPEYASSGKLTEKSDVFSFGVVLLEIITGRKPVDSTMPLGDESLVEWARPLLSRALETGELGELPDPRLEKNYNETEMFRMIEAAAACTRYSAAMRPQMGKVVRVLDSLADIDLSNGVTPGQSEAFNVAHSADIRIFQQLAFGNRGLSSDYSHSDWSREADA